MTNTDTGFAFLPLNRRSSKPRSRGLTEIRGPYYAPVGPRYLRDVLEEVAHAVDIFKFSGGSFSVISKRALDELIGICHEHDVRVSTGGFIERVLLWGPRAVREYLVTCKRAGFDIVEISSGFISVPSADLLLLTEQVKDLGLEPKPEINVQFGAGGASSVEALEAEGTRNVHAAIELGRRHLERGARWLMVESEGITEQVRSWRTDIATLIARELGIDKVMFEAADPPVFGWYVKNFGPEVNLFVDHSQIVQLECLRTGAWGTNDLWGRVVTYPAPT